MKDNNRDLANQKSCPDQPNHPDDKVFELAINRVAYNQKSNPNLVEPN